MSIRRSVPNPWADAMIRAGFLDGRYSEPVPSSAALAKRVGVHTSTITALIFRERDTDQATIEAVARALGESSETIAEWVGRAEPNPYRPPTVASLMTDDERAHVDWMIRRFTRDRAAERDQPAGQQDPVATERLEQVAQWRALTTDVNRQIREVMSKRRELVESGRRLDTDEQALVAAYDAKIGELADRLTTDPVEAEVPSQVVGE